MGIYSIGDNFSFIPDKEPDMGHEAVQKLMLAECPATSLSSALRFDGKRYPVQHACGKCLKCRNDPLP